MTDYGDIIIPSVTNQTLIGTHQVKFQVLPTLLVGKEGFDFEDIDLQLNLSVVEYSDESILKSLYGEEPIALDD